MIDRKTPKNCQSRILIVDDMPDIPDMIKCYLEKKTDCLIDITYSGIEALRLLPQNCLDHQCYSLIIIDYSMPVMDGLSLAKNIRDLEKHLGWETASIIFFTAHHDIARVSSSILADLAIQVKHVYSKMNMQQMFDDIVEHLKFKQTEREEGINVE